MAFNIEEFRKRRKFKYWFGSALFWGGLVLLILDCTTPFPTPVRAAYVYSWWIPIMTIGGIFYCLSKKLPLEEAMGIAREHNNKLTVTELVSELGVNIKTAEAVLTALRKKGYAKPQKRGQIIVWVFTESGDASSEMGSKKELTESGMTEAQLEQFLASCEEALGETREILDQLAPSNFKETVQKFCEVARKHIDKFREDPTKIVYFKDFPKHIEKMKSLLGEHIRLYKHRERESVPETLSTIEDTFGKATTSFDRIFDRLLLNDIEAVKGMSVEIDMIMKYRELDSLDL